MTQITLLPIEELTNDEQQILVRQLLDIRTMAWARAFGTDKLILADTATVRGCSVALEGFMQVITLSLWATYEEDGDVETEFYVAHLERIEDEEDTIEVVAVMRVHGDEGIIVWSKGLTPLALTPGEECCRCHRAIKRGYRYGDGVICRDCFELDPELGMEEDDEEGLAP